MLFLSSGFVAFKIHKPHIGDLNTTTYYSVICNSEPKQKLNITISCSYHYIGVRIVKKLIMLNKVNLLPIEPRQVPILDREHNISVLLRGLTCLTLNMNTFGPEARDFSRPTVGLIEPEVKRPGHATYSSLPSTANIKNEGRYTSTSHKSS